MEEIEYKGHEVDENMNETKRRGGNVNNNEGV
jgi:hypothetical protein